MPKAPNAPKTAKEKKPPAEPKQDPFESARVGTWITLDTSKAASKANEKFVKGDVISRSKRKIKGRMTYTWRVEWADGNKHRLKETYKKSEVQGMLVE